MSGNGGMKGFWAALQAHTDSQYQGAQSSATLIVTRTEKDSSGGVLGAYGTLAGEGDAEFYMPLRGVTTAVKGDRLLGTYPTNNPTGGELVYVRHVQSDNNPGVVGDADLPAPAWDTVPLTTALDASVGNISSYIVARFTAVAERYQPSGYTVSYRAAGGTWADQPVPHLGGAQTARLAINFPPGTAVDVRLRARYNWASAESLPGETRSLAAAVDDVTPGYATNVVAETNTPGGLNIFATGMLDPAHFKDWVYEIATSSGGAGLVTRPGNSPYFFTGPSGNYYVAVRPRSKTDVLGGRYPGVAGTYAGPFFLNNPAQPIDTTPPPDWTTAPGVSLTRIVTNNNGETAQLTVTLPTGYSYPSDYLDTLVYVVSNGSQQAPTQRIPYGATSATLTVPFGSVSVVLRGIDKSGNISANPSPAGTGTLAASGAPTAAPTLTVSTFAAAIFLSWTAVPNALAYEVYRAQNVGGSPGPWFYVTTIDARTYVDTLTDQTVVLPTYWYQVRAINPIGNGPYSAAKLGTAGAIDAQNLRLNSVTANQMAANSIAANSIIAGAVTAGKLEADLLMTSLIRTGPNGSDHLEMIGNVLASAYPNSIIAVSAGQVVQAQLNGAGLTFFKPDGTWALRSGQAGGQGYLESAGGFRIRGDFTELDLTNTQYMHWVYNQPDGAGNTFNHHQYLTRIRSTGSGGTVAYGMGLVGFQTLNGVAGSALPPRFIFGFTTDPLNPTNNLPAQRVEISGGTVAASANFRALASDDGSGATGYYFASGKRLYYNTTASTVDVDTAFRVLQNGNTVKTSADPSNAFIDWALGSLYLGLASNPGNYVIAGNGASGYGRMGASAFNVLSAESEKDDIADLTNMWEVFAKLRPRRYRLKSEGPDAPERVGYIAEEVAALLPQAATMLPALPYPGPVAPEYLPEETPALDVYALTTLIGAGAAQGLTAAFATIAGQAKTIQSQGTKLGQAQAKIDALTARVTELEKLTARVAALEGRLGL